MFQRARYQFGYLRRKPRKRKPDVWVWERNATGPDGRRKRETVIVGIYTQAVPDAMREANSRVVEMVLPKRKLG